MKWLKRDANVPMWAILSVVVSDLIALFKAMR